VAAEAARDGDGIHRIVDAAMRVEPWALPTLVDEIAEILGARAARLYVADYALRSLQQVGVDGPVGPPQLIARSLAGRSFTSGQVLASAGDPTVVSVPLVEGTDRIGLLQLDLDSWPGTVPAAWEPILSVLVMTLITRGRYTDGWARARRSEPLSPAAEIQWDLLPPLSCTTTDVSVAGILQPAYDIGGDSFDYALNRRNLEFAIVDAIGHGMPAVLMSTAAINSLRNARRAGHDLTAAYRQADGVITQQFGNSFYVTGQLGSLDVASGTLSWINAGHVPPMLVRNGTYAGELTCRPSMPLGLGGDVVQVATEHLQRGDRVLFYTDGIIEARAPDGAFFGDRRLADFLVRASLEEVPVAETARRLADLIIDFSSASLRDDATLVLVEYLPRDHAD
jgi:hypothetical protein